jgi:hypothetical protein
MTRDALVQALRTYGAGVDAEILLLDQLHDISASQRQITDSHDVESLRRATERREQLLAHLVTLEHDLKPLRESIARHRDAAMQLPGFAAIAERHRRAAETVATILTVDEETLARLREAETARRFAARAIEVGENTLAAYRRVVAPTLTSASLIDRRG